MAVSGAWLLTFSDKFRAAVGSLELVHIIPRLPELIEQSDFPVHCRNFFIWHDQKLQLLDINHYLTAKSDQSEILLPENEALVGIVAYISPDDNTQKYGALLLNRLPVRMEVNDEQECALPSSPEGWKSLGISCFQHSDFGPVPILDLPRIFSVISSQVI